MSRTALFFAIALLIQAGPASADMDTPLATWEAKCSLPGGAFQLRFASASGDAYEDDMRIELVAAGRNTAIPVAPALYLPRGLNSQLKSACDKVGALPLADGSLLFWLSRDERPQWNWLTLVLFDPARGKVLDVRERVAAIKDSSGRERLTIKPSGRRFLVRLIREEMQNTEIDGPENAIEDWMEVGVEAGRIRSRWARPAK